MQRVASADARAIQELAEYASAACCPNTRKPPVFYRLIRLSSLNSWLWRRTGLSPVFRRFFRRCRVFDHPCTRYGTLLLVILFTAIIIVTVEANCSTRVSRRTRTSVAPLSPGFRSQWFAGQQMPTAGLSSEPLVRSRSSELRFFLRRCGFHLLLHAHSSLCVVAHTIWAPQPWQSGSRLFHPRAQTRRGPCFHAPRWIYTGHHHQATHF